MLLTLTDFDPPQRPLLLVAHTTIVTEATVSPQHVEFIESPVWLL